ncbi:MAG: Bug family tripartite tricarboxylate transporter substrate binding protein [Burkholderiales bacterium]
MKPKQCLRKIAFVSMLGVMPIGALAQAYPTKPIRVVVPFPPGGVDVTVRQMQTVMTNELGQQLVIDNRAGANGYIGSEMVARAAPDGYTLLATSVALVTGPAITKAPFDVVKDFSPITQVFTTVGAVVVKPSLAVNNIRELVDYAKKFPGKLSYGTSGIGSAQHIDGEMLKLIAGIDMVHVPYKGGGPQIQAIVSQEVDISFFPMQQIRTHLVSGKARMIASYDGRRYAGMPNIPDITETLPEFRRLPGWVGVLGPAGLPQPIAQRLHGAMSKALATPDVKEKIEENSIIVARNPEEFSVVIKTEAERAVRVVQDLRSRGVKFE